MKAYALAATVFGLAAQAMAASQASATSAGLSAAFVDPAAPEVAELRAVGERALARTGYTLVAEASSSVRKSGPVAAMAVCHLKNMAAGGKAIPDMPQVKAVRRTSLRLRDSANAPDFADQLALDHIRRTLDRGDAPASLLVQRITREEKTVEWRLYRPLAVAPQCVACHGARADMSPELREEIDRRYPDDAASDYQAGEWRGILRVSLSDTE